MARPLLLAVLCMALLAVESRYCVCMHTKKFGTLVRDVAGNSRRVLLKHDRRIPDDDDSEPDMINDRPIIGILSQVGSSLMREA
jgi:hypothetical protein